MHIYYVGVVIHLFLSDITGYSFCLGSELEMSKLVFLAAKFLTIVEN